MKVDLPSFLASPVFSDLDRRLAEFIASGAGPADPAAGAAAALVSYQLRRGHVFLDLARAPAWEDPKLAPWPDWPTLAAWQEGLAGSPAVGSPGEDRPLLLTGSGKLYLQRYWAYEKLLAEKLIEHAFSVSTRLPEEVEDRLEAWFGDAEDQRDAARNALQRSFSVISGGPGTGKTTTVLKILALLLEQDPALTVQLAAPTGKAAARLQESIRDGLARLDCGPDLRNRISGLQASTIHRLLGPIPGSVFFRCHAGNPLPADVLVLDEASMVDLPLMAKLFDALAPGARVIVLGDKDQLASVEAGSVLSGIVDAALTPREERDHSPLAGTATLLTRNYRFGNESGIFHLCNAVRDGAGETVVSLLSEASAGADVTWQEAPTPARLKEALRPVVVAGLADFLDKKDPAEALAAWGGFQLLTPVRAGPFGKEALNVLVEEILREEGLITPGRRHFAGRPVMVTENDYAVRLFNGDVGVMLEDEQGELMAFFRSDEGGIRKIAPLRLPFTEPAFAMTVHKSQGSEFDEVLMLLPARDSQLLTRELLYTGISRARKRVRIWGSLDLVRAAVERRVARGSGLSEMVTAARPAGSVPEK